MSCLFLTDAISEDYTCYICTCIGCEQIVLCDSSDVYARVFVYDGGEILSKN